MERKVRLGNSLHIIKVKTGWNALSVGLFTATYEYLLTTYIAFRQKVYVQFYVEKFLLLWFALQVWKTAKKT